MQFIYNVNIEDWCAENGGRQTKDDWTLQDNPALIHTDILRYPLNPDNSPRPQPVRDACLSVMGDWQECLLWVTVTGIFASGEDWPAFYALRGEDGERISLGDTPGHLFTWEERDRFARYLDVVVSNLWDAWILPTTQGQPETVRLMTSHDECVDLWSSTPRKFPQITVPTAAQRPENR